MLGRSAADPDAPAPSVDGLAPTSRLRVQLADTAERAAPGPRAAVVAQRRRLLRDSTPRRNGQEPGKVAQRFKLGFCAPRGRRAASR
jgi:hypothetical protein